MKLDSKGYKALHDREGLRLRPYLDTQGVPTIAMGNTYYLDGRSVKMSDRALSLQEATNLSEIVTNDFAKFVDSKIKVKVNQDQFNACVSICYNIGKTGFENSTFLKLINKNPNDHNIASAIMQWVKDKELIGRRCSEVVQYFSAR